MLNYNKRSKEKAFILAGKAKVEAQMKRTEFSGL